MNLTSRLSIKTVCFFIILISNLNLLAQQEGDFIYLVDETPIKCDLIELTSKKLKYKNTSGQVRSYNLEEVLVLFNRSGEFLAFPKSSDVDNAVDFINAPKKSEIDLLITLDQKVVPAYIATVNENEVFYENVEDFKGEQTFGKDVLAAIIHRDGHHDLLVSPSQAAEILFKLNEDIKKYRSKPYGKTAVANVPESSTESATSPNNSIAGVSPKAANELGTSAAEIENSVPPPANAVVAEEKPASREVGTTVAVAAPNPTVPTSASTSSEPMIDFNLYKKKALQKTEDLGTYLAIISDKSTDFQEANKAINQGCALFADEDAKVEVSSSNNPTKTRYKIREYFNRLKLLKYDRVEISWTNISYVSNLKKGVDGRYYGVITLEQTFRGMNEGQIVYSDITKKNIEVVLKSYTKEVGGESKEMWDILLRDIGVVVTKNN